MTVIIWLKHKWDVRLASDSRISNGDEISDDKYCKQITSHWATFWWAGSVRCKNALQYVLQVLLKDTTNKIYEENDVYAVYNMLFKHARDTWYINNWDTLPIQSVIITETGKLFSMESDWACMECNDYAVAGSWWDTAATILSQLDINNHPETSLKYVMKEVFKVHSWTGWKIWIKMYPWKKTKAKLLKLLKSKKKK